MSDGVLKVDPAPLTSAGKAFAQAGDGLAGLRTDSPLGDAAAAVPLLRIAVACLEARAELTAEMTAVADGARQLSENLGTAARWYEERDLAAAEAIAR